MTQPTRVRIRRTKLHAAPLDLFDAAATHVRTELVKHHFLPFVTGLAESLSPLAMPRRNFETMRAIYIVSPDAIVTVVQLLSRYYRRTFSGTEPPATPSGPAALQLVTVRGLGENSSDALPSPRC